MNPCQVLILITTVLILQADFSYADEESYLLPGDSRRGIEIFFEKKCATCHSVLGEGAKSAPDLGNTPAGHLSATQMAGVMWNHAPRMWKGIEGEKIAYPKISQDEMADLFAFLYSVRYFDEPGNPDRGKALLEEQHCIDCHAIQGKGGEDGPDLSQEARYINPVIWAQVMWNHARHMEKMTKERGFPWPQLQGADMVDLIAYIRSVAPPQKTYVDLLPAEPEIGKTLFSTKGCGDCHAIHGKGGQIGPDLGGRKTALPRTLSQFAQRMWNHAPDMWEIMKEKKIERAEFSEREMADLIAYLYSFQLFDEPGDKNAGARVFADKKCPICHTSDGAGGQPGPDLSKWKPHLSPISLSYIMWNHGPAMFKEMEESKIQWPLFDGREIIDLMEYLNTGKSE